MRVTVTLKKNGKFHRIEAGRMRFYTDKDPPFTISQHVFEAFRDRFNVVGEAPTPAAQPTGQALGTDDEPLPDPAERQEQAQGSEDAVPTLTDDQSEAVDALAQVGIRVDPGKASAWTDAELTRVAGVAARGGKGNLPAFLKAAMLPTE